MSSSYRCFAVCFLPAFALSLACSGGGGTPAPTSVDAGPSDARTACGDGSCGGGDAGADTGGIARSPSCRDPGTVAPFPVRVSGSHPTSMTLGPDGYAWFTDPGSKSLGRVTTPGQVAEYQLFTEYAKGPSGLGTPNNTLVVGADGQLWTGGIDSLGSPCLWQFDPVTVTANNYLLYDFNSSIMSVAVGPDKNIWFGEAHGNTPIGRFSKDAGLVQYLLPRTVGPDGGAFVNSVGTITAGPGGNLWFTAAPLGMPESPERLPWLGEMATDGGVTQFPFPVAGGPVLFPALMTVGADGNLWIGGQPSSADGGPITALSIWQVTPGGVFTEFPLPPVTPVGTSGTVNFGQLTVGPDDNVWFTLVMADADGGVFANLPSGRIAPDGTIEQFPQLAASGVATGTGGFLWLSLYTPDDDAGYTGYTDRVLLDGPCPTDGGI